MCDQNNLIVKDKGLDTKAFNEKLKYKWWLVITGSFENADEFAIAQYKRPNFFIRFFQKLFLGFTWKKYNGG